MRMGIYKSNVNEIKAIDNECLGFINRTIKKYKYERLNRKWKKQQKHTHADLYKYLYFPQKTK